MNHSVMLAMWCAPDRLTGSTSWLPRRSPCSNARGSAELRERFFVKARRPLVLRLADYLDSRIAAGQLRPVPDTKVTARFIIESVAWFANHRHGDLDSASIDDETAETTVVDMLTAAL